MSFTKPAIVNLKSEHVEYLRQFFPHLNVDQYMQKMSAKRAYVCIIRSVRGSRNEIAALRIFDIELDNALLHYVAVSPQFRGNGLGKILTQATETFLKHHGVKKVIANVRYDNEASNAMFRSLGYSLIDNSEKYSNGEIKNSYEKELD